MRDNPPGALELGDEPGVNRLWDSEFGNLDRCEVRDLVARFNCRVIVRMGREDRGVQVDPVLHGLD